MGHYLWNIRVKCEHTIYSEHTTHIKGKYMRLNKGFESSAKQYYCGGVIQEMKLLYKLLMRWEDVKLCIMFG